MKEKCLQEVIYTLYLRPLFLHSRIANSLSILPSNPFRKTEGIFIIFRKYHVIIFEK